MSGDPRRRAGIPGTILLLMLVAAATAVGSGVYLATRGLPRYFRDVSYWQQVLPARALVLLFVTLILVMLATARRRSLFIRRIPGLSAIDEAVGRATEMGRPIAFSLGMGELDIVPLQGLAIAIYVIRLAIRFTNRVILTMANPVIYVIAEEAVRDAYQAEGRPESFRAEDVRFLSDRQFAYASAMVGIIQRERVASNFMFGKFFAESLILAEAGNQVGAIQVAGTPQTTQIPFFVACCDYTMIGDEYYAASAYLTREPGLLGSLVGQDYGKIVLLTLIAVGATVVSLQVFFPHFLPQLPLWFKKTL
jgi:hypothetical protein